MHKTMHETMHKPLSVDSLLDRARRESGLEDFGTKVFIPPMRQFVESVNGILDKLHHRGRVGIEDRVVRLLVNRLRMQRDLGQHPEIREETLLPPAAIIGLPRTGSTKLQRLLAAGHGLHELLMWQAYNPAPFNPDCLTNNDSEGLDPRIQAASGFVSWMAADAPDSHKGHMMVVEGAEEENHLLEQTFETPSAVSFVPAYSWCRYIERTDKTELYAHLRTSLQYLQWQFHRDEHKRWLLKYPANLGNETYIERTFPGVQFVVTHRDPFPVMASLNALIMATHELYCHTQDSKRFSRWAMDEFSCEMERHLAWREANPEAQFLDVSFKDIVRDGFAVAQRIYQFLDVPWTPEIEADIREWLVENEQQKDKLHYQLKDLDYTEEECRARFAEYYARFSDYF